MTPDELVLDPGWSDVAARRALPEIDHDRMRAYRLGRIRDQMRARDVDLVILHSPISLRYAIDYRNYALFQAHIPQTYVFVSPDGPVIGHATIGSADHLDEVRPGRALTWFDGGTVLEEHAEQLARDVDHHLRELGSGRRVAIEYVNPTVTRALLRHEIDVVDGVDISEAARIIKSEDEIACIRWSIAVAEVAAETMIATIRPGVTEAQLWGLLNYCNLANQGDWHDGRMLASGPRTNPWLQEASGRAVEEGDLVAFDTDMIGPGGYMADLSRTVQCGPTSPTARQRELYRTAHAEVEHNLTLMRPGMTFSELRAQAYDVPEEFHEQAYPALIHGVGMCDEWPRVDQRFQPFDQRYDGTLEPGMVVCVESYIGAVGETDGVKLEQQVLITDDGYEPLTTFPYDERLLG